MPAHSADFKQAFLDAVRRRDLAGAQATLDVLRARQTAPDEEGLAAWVRYFEGILANERDHDLAAGERIFLEVAQRADADLELQSRLFLALALTCCRQNRLQSCMDYSQRSLACCRARGDNVGQAKALKQSVIALATGFDQGLFGPDVLPAIEQQCRQALALLEDAAPTEETQWLAGTLWNEIGAYHRARQEWAQAAAAYRRNLAICETIDHRSGLAVAYGNLGELLFKQGQAYWAEAEADFRRSLEIAQAAGFRGQQLDALVNLAYLQTAAGRLAEALDTYCTAIALIDTLRSGISTEAARAGFFATVTETFANAVLAAVAAGQPDEALYLAEQARARAFLDLLASGAVDNPLLTTSVLTASQICQALAPDEALLAYFTTGLMAAPAGRDAGSLDRNRFPPASTLIFVVAREGVDVVTADTSPNDLQPRRLAGAAERHFLQLPVRRALYDRLVAPVAAGLAGKRRLYLVPHGPLHYVPFQALLAPDGETLLRPGGPELVYGPSATVLFGRPSRLPKTSKVSELPCLALGFDGEGGQRLRFAEEEASRIAALLGGEALVGPAGKREALLQRGPAARTLHISCHGQFDPAAPLESFLHLGAGETLTAQQVLESLRLRCDLVTLSACESGLSQVRRGDELMGLVRAFLAAGAPAVIATLWRVDERSTRLLMEQFYREVAAGASFARALQQAQIFLRDLSRREAIELLGSDAPDVSGAERPFADPFYWAPFVLVGDG